MENIIFIIVTATHTPNSTANVTNIFFIVVSAFNCAICISLSDIDFFSCRQFVFGNFEKLLLRLYTVSRLLVSCELEYIGYTHCTDNTCNNIEYSEDNKEFKNIFD